MYYGLNIYRNSDRNIFSVLINSFHYFQLGGLYSILEDIHDIANNNTGKLCADRKGVR